MMGLDLTKPRGDRVLIPRGIPEAQPVFPDIVYYMPGEPNASDVIATVSGLIRKSGHAAHAAKYQRQAMKSESYSELISFTCDWVHILVVE